MDLGCTSLVCLVDVCDQQRKMTCWAWFYFISEMEILFAFGHVCCKNEEMEVNELDTYTASRTEGLHPGSAGS